MKVGMASTGIDLGIAVVGDWTKKEIRRSASPSFGKNSLLNPRSNCEMKNGDALKLRWPSAAST